MAKALELDKIAEYLRKKLGKVEVELKGNPFAFNLSETETLDYARRFASIKIQKADQKMLSEQEPLYGEIQYEERRIRKDLKVALSIMRG